MGMFLVIKISSVRKNMLGFSLITRNHAKRPGEAGDVLSQAGTRRHELKHLRVLAEIAYNPAGFALPRYS